MLSRQCLAVAVWAFVPIAAAAQQKQPYPSPLDANAPVSAIPYESSFKTFRGAMDEGETPDKVWRAANKEMGTLGGHAGHMKDSNSQPAPSPDAHGAPPKQGGSTGHGKHHQGDWK